MTKDEAFENFKSWKHLVQNQIGKTMKRFKTDNGLEVCSKLFNNFCKDNNIVRHRTIVGTPQQNGLA